ncbi:hypothetical protein EON63_05755 [archaeon]|nr:MAG: hypothetical protein EON63_05755 [archaeon]
MKQAVKDFKAVVAIVPKDVDAQVSVVVHTMYNVNSHTMCTIHYTSSIIHHTPYTRTSSRPANA